MVDDTQNSASLQPTGVTNGDTNNPQQIPQVANLQPQASAQLQPTSIFTPSDLAGLDQGSSAIQLSSVTTTTSATVAQVNTKTQSTPVVLYGFVAIACMAAFIYIVRGLLKHRA